MKFAQLDAVVLRRDVPEPGLRAGDLGAVVEMYGEPRLEVEFVQASGHTGALVTLKTDDVRAVSAQDILAVHPRKLRSTSPRSACIAGLVTWVLGGVSGSRLPSFGTCARVFT
jgi:Domain of unknown function (DUF4926)